MFQFELKKYLILKRQALFRDMQSGISLNLFSLKNAFCETPEKVLKNLKQYPNVLTALRLGHLVTDDNPPIAGARREKQVDSPMVGILAQDPEAFRQRIMMLKSIDLLDQLLQIEGKKTSEEGGPRRVYLGIMEARKGMLMSALDEDNKEAYNSNDDPTRKTKVARIPVAKAELVKSAPKELQTKKKPKVKKK
jgi:hypothetical protein